MEYLPGIALTFSLGVSQPLFFIYWICSCCGRCLFSPLPASCCSLVWTCQVGLVGRGRVGTQEQNSGIVWGWGFRNCTLETCKDFCTFNTCTPPDKQQNCTEPDDWIWRVKERRPPQVGWASMCATAEWCCVIVRDMKNNTLADYLLDSLLRLSWAWNSLRGENDAAALLHARDRSFSSGLLYTSCLVYDGLQTGFIGDSEGIRSFLENPWEWT